MSTEEVKALVDELRFGAEYGCDYDLIERAAAAIEELQAAEPTEKQVVDYCHKRCLVVLGADLFHELKASYGKMPKRGEWVGVSPTVDTVQCSVCGGQLFSEELKTPYCPYCGAKMEVQDGDT